MRAALAALVIAFVLAGVSPLLSAYPFDEVPRGPAAQPSHFIHLKAGTFDPLVEGTGWAPLDWRLSASNPWGDLYIVQVKAQVLAGEREALMATGAQYHSYLPDDGVLVFASAVEATSVRQLDL